MTHINHHKVNSHIKVLIVGFTYLNSQSKHTSHIVKLIQSLQLNWILLSQLTRKVLHNSYTGTYNLPHMYTIRLHDHMLSCTYNHVRQMISHIAWIPSEVIECTLTVFCKFPCQTICSQNAFYSLLFTISSIIIKW